MTSTDLPRALQPELLDLPVRGRNLRGPTLRENLGPEPTLVSFLRHLG